MKSLPSVPKRILESSFILPQEDDRHSNQEAILSSVFVELEYNYDGPFDLI